MRVPSTQALRALEAFSRNGSIWQTAEELHLTRSAISHQLRYLEQEIGFKIMEKVGTRVEITPRGLAYAKDIRKALNILHDSRILNAAKGMTGKLTVSCPAGFAASWLSPRIGSFLDTHPDIILEVVTPKRLDDIEAPDIDVFVIFGRKPEVDAILVRQMVFAPLCSPSYLNVLEGFNEGRMAQDGLSRARLLHIGNYQDWERWLSAASLPPRLAHRGAIFSDMNLAYTAALSSQGILVGDEFVCLDALQKGLLVRPFDIIAQTDSAYYLVCAERGKSSSLVAAFSGWFEAEISKFQPNQNSPGQW